MLSDEFVSNRLARISLLHTYDKAFEIRDSMHVWMAVRIDDQRLARNRVGCAEVCDPFAVGSDRGARGNAIIGVIVEAGKDAVEVGTRVADKLPFAAELLGDTLHECDIEARRTGIGHELEWWVRQSRAHPQ